MRHALKNILSVVALAAFALPLQAASVDLYFSEYVEGSSNNKALEIFNDTGSDINLSPYTVSYFFNGSVSAGTTINLSGVLLNGDVFVLVHSSASAAVLAEADQTNGSIWFNGDDAIALVKSGAFIDVIGQIGFDPGSEWGSGNASTQNNTMRRLPFVVDGDTNGSNPFDPSLEWSGSAIDTFSGLGVYPNDPAGPRGLSIGEIQGPGHTSPFDGLSVSTAGVVTAVSSNGFYLQDPIGDGDSLTSDGIFVFTFSAPTVSVGDALNLAATVDEFVLGTGSLSVTELTNPSISTMSSANPLPALIVLGAMGSSSPTEVIDDDALAIFDPANDGIDFYETFEGMRVQLDGALAVSPRNKFDELYAVADGGVFATGMNSRSGITISSNDFNPERIQLQLEAGFTPGFNPNVLIGDDLGSVIGVMHYSFGNFELIVTEPFAVTPNALPEDTATGVGRRSVLSVASYNVLNLDPKVESIGLVNGGSNIDDDIGDGRFDAIAVHIVNNLRKPDIVALQEVQDNDGAELTGITDASLTYQTLIAAIEAQGGPTYDFRDLPPVNLADGGQPGGNIRVGYLFNPSRVSVDDASLQRLVDTDLTNGDAFAFSRKPLVASFDFYGTQITLINNHFTSKGGSTQLFGSIQPPINGNVDKRTDQAVIVSDHVLALLGSNPDANIIVLGDLNEFEFNQPLQVLEGQPAQVLTNLTKSLDANERFSFVFKGNSQALDHVLVSNSLAGIAEHDVVHVNTDGSGSASDHDPLLSRFRLPRRCHGVSSSFGSLAELNVCGESLFPALPAIGTLSGISPGSSWLLFASSKRASTTFRGELNFPYAPFASVPLNDDDHDGIINFKVPSITRDSTFPIYLQAAKPGMVSNVVTLRAD